MSEFGEIQKEFAEIADFLVVYIQEVHVKEGWFFEVSIVSFFVYFYNFYYNVYL